MWTITGRLLVRESEIDGDSHDRPLKGIEVKVSASDIGADGPWTEWGTVRTDADGDFSLAETNNGRTRFFRVQARLNSADLEVEDGTLDDIGSLDLLDRNWRTIWKSGAQLDGPAVSVGTRVIASGQSFDLGDAIFRRPGADLVRAARRHRPPRGRGAWFAINPEIKAIYPAHGDSATSWNGERQDLPARGTSRMPGIPTLCCTGSCSCGTTTTPTACARPQASRAPTSPSASRCSRPTP